MRKQSGLTLIELIVGMAILAILATTAVPSFVDFVRRNRLATQTNDLVTAINIARSEAVKRSQQVSICASGDQATCSGSTDWTDGWIVFRDTGSAGSPTVDEVLRTWPARDQSMVLDGPAQLQYDGDGSVVSPATFTLYYSGCNGQSKREIEISAVGRPETESASC